MINIDKKEIEVFQQPVEKLYEQLEIYLSSDQVAFKFIYVTVSADNMLI